MHLLSYVTGTLCVPVYRYQVNITWDLTIKSDKYYTGNPLLFIWTHVVHLHGYPHHKKSVYGCTFHCLVGLQTSRKYWAIPGCGSAEHHKHTDNQLTAMMQWRRATVTPAESHLLIGCYRLRPFVYIAVTYVNECFLWCKHVEHHHTKQYRTYFFRPFERG